MAPGDGPPLALGAADLARRDVTDVKKLADGCIASAMFDHNVQPLMTGADPKPIEEDLPALPAMSVPTPEQVQGGPPLSPQQRIGLYDAAEWEAFVLEWAHALGGYSRVRRLGSAGDQGRDIVAYITAAADSEFDVYQCKHYEQALTPSEVVLELGKLCWHVFKGHYSKPRRYFFIAPRGCGTKLTKMLENPTELRTLLVTEWDKKCRQWITKAEQIELTAELRTHIDGFDFSIIKDLAPHEMIDQHRPSPHFVRRFGGGLPPLNDSPSPPGTIATGEIGYVAALLNAYGEHLASPIAAASQLTHGSECAKHLIRSREEFFDAELLRSISRDQLGDPAYSAFLEQVLNGIADVVDADAGTGFERVKKATALARTLNFSADPHDKRLTVRRRAGTCHQLANDGRVSWVKP